MTLRLWLAIRLLDLASWLAKMSERTIDMAVIVEPQIDDSPMEWRW